MLKLVDKTPELRKRRKILDLTQKELAGRSGVSQSLVAKLESGKIDPSYSSVQRIDSALSDLERLNGNNDVRAGDIMNSPVVVVRENEKISRVIKIMWDRGFSQLPVSDGKIFAGSVSEEDILRAREKHGALKGKEVKEIMNDSFPVVSKNTGLGPIRELLKENKAVLVIKDGRTGIITKSDFLRA